MEFAWTGFDCGSGDHPMNTTIRYKRPDAGGRTRSVGKSVDEQFPRRTSSSCTGCRSGTGSRHVENIGGDIERCWTAAA